MTTHAEYAKYRGRGSLADVVNELRRQVDARLDFVMDSREFKFGLRLPEKKDSEPVLVMEPKSISAQEFIPSGGYPVLDQALQQVAAKAPVKGGDGRTSGIPVRFFRNALKSHPERTLDFLNGMIADAPARRMVRVLDGEVRAFLSDQYRVIDNLTVATHVLEILQKVDGRLLEASISDSHMRLKFLSAEVWDKIERVRTGEDSGSWYAGGLGSQTYLSKVAANTRGDLPMHGGPDTVWPIGTISNSETGHGGFTFRGGLLQAVCFNLATVEEVIREVHLGSRLEVGEYKRDTVEAEAEAIFLKVRDNVTTFFTPEEFRKIVAKVRGSQTKEIQSASTAAGLLVKTADSLAEQDLDALLNYFHQQPGKQTVYNLGQAVARFAQDTDNPERADDLETLAGQVLCGRHDAALAEVLA